jgi:hypothetical protein
MAKMLRGHSLECLTSYSMAIHTQA